MSPNAAKIEAMVNVENTTAVAAKRTRIMASPTDSSPQIQRYKKKG